VLPQTTKAKFVETASLFLPIRPCLHLICISCQPVPFCPATLAQSGNLCQWHGPPPSHPLQFAHTTCDSHQHGTGSSLVTGAIEVILKIHIDPRCSMFIICCSHLHHAGLGATSWFGFHKPLLAASAPRFRCSKNMSSSCALHGSSAHTLETVG
jgi:hypothetical protein